MIYLNSLMEQFKKTVSLILGDDEGKELTIKFIASKAGQFKSWRHERSHQSRCLF